MDFTLDETQQAIADLSNQILADRIKPEELRGPEDKGEWFDKDTYAQLAKTGLLGIAIAEDISSGDISGGGMGLVELGQVLEAQGRHLAPLPIWNSCLAALAIDRFGTEEQRMAELPRIIDGSVVLALGIQEWYDDNYLSPNLKATSTKEDVKITGTKIMVEFAKESAKMLLTAKDGAGKVGMYLMDLNQSGITFNEGSSTRHQKCYEVVMDNVSATQVGSISTADLEWFMNAAIALICATQIGVCDQALKMAAEYTSTREQFGRPIATFQAVTHRLADQYIHVKAIRLTTYSALWSLDNTGEEVDAQHATLRTCEAKWFSSHFAMDVANATQHVHGGIGVDRDYPLHRYTLWNKHLQTSLGAGALHLRRLGALLVDGYTADY